MTEEDRQLIRDLIASVNALANAIDHVPRSITLRQVDPYQGARGGSAVYTGCDVVRSHENNKS